MKSIREDYRARAASFENTEEWQNYVHENTDWIVEEAGSDAEKKKYEEIHNNMIRNCYLIRYFADDLKKSGKLADKTIRKHVDNLMFYLNTFAVEETGANAEKALQDSAILSFMGYFFPRKVLWSSAETTKSNCASLKKFATWMNQNDLISDGDLMELKDLIKVMKSEWLDQYEDEESFW